MKQITRINIKVAVTICVIFYKLSTLSNPTENSWNKIPGGVIVTVVIFVYKQLITSSKGKTKVGT